MYSCQRDAMGREEGEGMEQVRISAGEQSERARAHRAKGGGCFEVVLGPVVQRNLKQS